MLITHRQATCILNCAFQNTQIVHKSTKKNLVGAGQARLQEQLEAKEEKGDLLADKAGQEAEHDAENEMKRTQEMRSDEQRMSLLFMLTGRT